MSMIMQWIRVPAAQLAVITDMNTEDFVEWCEARSDDTVDVDKAWHAIHAVLTGTAWDLTHDLSGVVLGGAEFGDDVGYGPARSLTPAEVRALAGRLQALPVEDFSARVDMGRLAGLDIYPQVWSRDDEREVNLDYVSSGYRAVRDVFLEAAAAGDAMVVFCS